ncbi:MAG TPA: TonB-dependent receptor, partial [Steroidobacteraceae bacterium]|nr:TonB-dependent receptor [Steroidobacteraceae bacterium]
MQAKGFRCQFSLDGAAAKTSLIALATLWSGATAAQEAERKVLEPIEEVVVTGIRESLESSAAIKRNSLEVVDSITAEDIGKLPDSNVAETMTRIPGVQGYRYGGEGASPVGVGSGLTIRGLSGQTASRVDGRAYFTAGNREFNIEGAIPGMIAGIDVYKNPDAQHIEGGIGGLVNIRTRRPLDFDGLTLSAATNLRYNDLSESLQPDFFGLFSNRWDAGDGEFGFLIAANVQESHNRSDSNPGNGGTSLRRAIRADSAEYTTTAGANQAYAGQGDVWFLADVPNPLALTTTERADLITAATQQAPIFEEDILRTRRGFNAAFQWKPSDDLEFYAETNYNYYLYHQEYRFLFANDTRTVQALAIAPFELTEGLANRNINGGSDEILAGQRLVSGTFLDSTLSTAGGDEDHPYETVIYAAGFKWNAGDNLELGFDVAYVKADQHSDNRSVNSVSAPGLTWDVSRDLDTAPHQIGFEGGPALDASTTWMFSDYGNGTNSRWDDEGLAAQLDATYRLDTAFLRAIKFGTRWATQEARFNNYNFSGRPLTTNGLPLSADRSNGISFAALQDLTERAPDNWMDGEAGYPGGYAVFSPSSLLGDNVRNRFPLAGIPAEDSLPENLPQRRFAREDTLALYVQGEFSLFNERISGNAGVRVVKADLTARAMVVNVPGPGVTPNSSSNGYTDVLPSLNVVGHVTDEFQVRFGYGKGLTRPALDALNPSLVVNTTNGTGSRGNPELDPLTADSFDLSAEWYFSPVGYLSVGLFDKEIDGFFTGVSECESVAGVPAYAGATPNGCIGGQYFITRTVNSEPGYARGVEVAGQTFFDFLPGVFSHFGVQGSYAHVETENPVRFTPNGPIFNVAQAFQSEDNYVVAALYDDGKISSRLVYTYRSDYVLFGVAQNPIDGRYLQGYGIV